MDFSITVLGISELDGDDTKDTHIAKAVEVQHSI